MQNQQDSIMHVKSVGKISIQMMVERMDAALLNTNLPRRIKILEDATLADADFSPDELDILVQRLKYLLPRFEAIFHAVIHVSPKNTAYTLSLMDTLEIPNYKLQVFSTKKAALAWLAQF